MGATRFLDLHLHDRDRVVGARRVTQRALEGSAFVAVVGTRINSAVRGTAAGVTAVLAVCQALRSGERGAKSGERSGDRTRMMSHHDLEKDSAEAATADASGKQQRWDPRPDPSKVRVRVPVRTR